MQLAFCPIDYCFAWTDTWYEWDAKEARKQALKARDAKVRELRAEGKTVIKWTCADQLVRRGGIGSGHPDIEAFVSVYMINVR